MHMQAKPWLSWDGDGVHVWFGTPGRSKGLWGRASRWLHSPQMCIPEKIFEANLVPHWGGCRTRILCTPFSSLILWKLAQLWRSAQTLPKVPWRHSEVGDLGQTDAPECYLGGGGVALGEIWNGEIRCGQNLVQILKLHGDLVQNFQIVARGKSRQRELNYQLFNC